MAKYTVADKDVFGNEYAYITGSGFLLCITCGSIVLSAAINLHGGFHENQRLIYQGN